MPILYTITDKYMHYETILPKRVPFIYTGTERYIRVTETFRKSDEPSISRCLILDEQLSIVSKKANESIDLEALKGTTEESDCNLPKISYLVQRQGKPVLFTKQYEKYPQLSDFQIGRDSWGRTQNCLKIANDHVSRYHTRIEYKNQVVQQQRQRLNSKLRLVVAKARCSSNWRKLPKNILEMIVDYGVIAPYYTVQDCGSRNGTFLIDFAKEDILRKGEVYQFESQQYKIEIVETLVESGNAMAERMRQFDQRWYPHESCQTKIIASGMTDMEALRDMGRLHAIQFQITYPHHLAYSFLIVNSGEDEEYFVGEGQEVNINSSGESENYETSRHGRIVFQSGKWLIASTNPSEKVWRKLKPKVEYRLDTRHRYKLSVGHLTAIDVQFFNYFP